MSNEALLHNQTIGFVDDQVTEGIPAAMASQLEGQGATVFRFKNGHDLIERMRHGVNLNLLLIDWELHRDFDHPADYVSSFDLIRDVLREFGLIPICIATRFMGRVPSEHFVDPRVPFAALDKPTSEDDVTSWVAQQLIPDILQLEAKLDSEGSAQIAFSLQKPLQLFDLPIETISSVPDLELRQMRRDAFLSTEEWCSSVFSTTRARWLALARSDNRLVVARWGDTSDSIPSSAEVRQLERDTGHPILVVGRPPRMEEIEVGHQTWNECSWGEIEHDLYPSICLEIRGQERSFHFDTGSVQSFLDFNLLAEDKIVNELTAAWSRMSVRGRSEPYEFMQLPDTTEFATPQGNGSIRVPFQLVIDWNSAPVSLVCRTGACIGSVVESNTGYRCGRRSGLIGRDIIRVNLGTRIVLDSPEMRTYFVGPGDEGRKWFKLPRR